MFTKLLSRHKDKTCSLTRAPRVLLVEDDGLVAFVHKSLLSKLSCKVDIAINGKEALSMVKLKSCYDLILLDIGLPDMSGIEVAKNLHHHFQIRCPVMVAITALSSDEIIKNCLEVGISQVFIKPVDLAAFKRILSHNVLVEE
jgi:two-component system aerobic respiration control sensor histidine kinase ArcB